ncbi:hypothetical protein [Tepidibacter aestuarii]|uniref:hypothetical protein n=1 Tax=Tepidibacter aestuarii TaxID=2925782 RepID=UPI0020BF9F90|nr:hypothetical protein [Tepidibacter aestuarii]CAH2212596.1 protein of unknown function [Tepidibacter aestuarii]
MNKEFISDNQGIALITFIIIADKVIFTVEAQAERDFGLSVIFDMVISVPMLSISTRFNFLFPKKFI